MNPPPSPTSSLRVKRESSTFSTSSWKSKAPASGIIPSFPSRERVSFTPNLDSAVSRLPDVGGRPDLANYNIAEQLKTMLDDDEHPAPPPASPSDDVKPDTPVPFIPLSRLSGGISERLLSEAFRREYSSTVNDDRKRAYSTMYPEEEEDRSARFSRAPSFAGSMASQSEYGGGGRKKARLEIERPSQPLVLYGLGEGRQRGVNGKSLFGGQDLGVGVIGSQAYLESAGGEDGGSNTNQQCDISVAEEGCDWRVRQIEGEQEGMRFMVGPHIVSLEEDLPPLAAEHPTRVWNSVLHSLPQTLLPTVQWKYERVMQDDDDDEPGHICQLTLSLSPLHPAIAQHPAFPKLPTNRHTSEYITAVAAIGGSKTWTGEAKAIKGDATKSALLKCISSGAFEWLHSSTLDNATLATIEDTIQPFTSPAPELQSPPSSPSFTGPAASSSEDATAIETTYPSLIAQPLNLDIYPSDDVQNSANVNANGTTAENPKSDSHDSHDLKQVVQVLFRAFHRGLIPIFSLTIEWNDKSNVYIERLNIGVEGRTQTFQAYTQGGADHPYFGSAVIKDASEQGLLAFLEFLRTMEPSSNLYSKNLHREQHDERIIYVPGMNDGDEEDMLVDWVEQLKGFCRSNNLRFPTYTQQVVKISDKGGERVTFKGSVKLEEEIFCAKTTFNTILQTRQAIARWIFSEHFGQKATIIDFQAPDSGYKGRGGRGGSKRGRRW